MEEREFLRQTAEEIVQKVYNLEKIVRKEKGDQNPESPNTVQPVWKQDLSKYNIYPIYLYLWRTELKISYLMADFIKFLVIWVYWTHA